jgi:hypothetical protein
VLLGLGTAGNGNCLGVVQEMIQNRAIREHVAQPLTPFLQAAMAKLPQLRSPMSLSAANY